MNDKQSGMKPKKQAETASKPTAKPTAKPAAKPAQAKPSQKSR
jgi:hypothetical protein